MQNVHSFGNVDNVVEAGKVSFCLICVPMVNVISLDSRQSGALITVVLGLPVPIDFALRLFSRHLPLINEVVEAHCCVKSNQRSKL